MDLFYFGASDRALLGVFHPPEPAVDSGHAIVLCYPMGQEYFRSHRAFRQLAILLARRGFSVLRFDYYGTGDAMGSSEAGSVDQWVKDITTAVDELREMTGAGALSLVGLRLGAALAALASSRLTSSLDTLVLWDPVVRGTDYLVELDAWTDDRPGASRNGRRIVGVMGFPMSDDLRREIGAVDLTRMLPLSARRVLLLVSERDGAKEELRTALQASGAAAEYRCVESEGEWAEVDDVGSFLLPHEMIRGIVAAMAGDGDP